MRSRKPEHDYEHVWQWLLRYYRGRMSRADAGLPPLESRRGGPRPPGLRQVDVDVLLCGGAGVYAKIENNDFRPQPELFLRITELLKFSPYHLRIAYLDLYGAEPVLPVQQPSPHWRKVLNGQSEMACALMPDGHLVAANDAFAELFATGRPPTNFWRWALWSEEAQAVLVDREKWVARLVTELRLAQHRYPDDRAVQKICADLERDPRLQQLTESLVGLDNEALPLHHRKRGRGTARFMASHTPAGLSVWTVLFEAAA
ncbi:MmyB family transcriptional regulator [Streptomyces sviceus]|uniref:MmyB family transcriptional regulator n=1 Tax=Streptomyces sviceus TaxID=285530 RepID=UPI00369C7B01